MDRKDEEQAKRDAAFARLMELRRKVPEIDDKKALAEYRDEKFGEYCQNIQNNHNPQPICPVCLADEN